MADWSRLPPEILYLIAKCLETRFDVLRFRSVCSSWRSSFPPKLYSLPKFLLSKTRGILEYPLDLVHIKTFYLVRLPGANQAAPACWLVYIRHDAYRGKMQLLRPLSKYQLNRLRVKFPKVLDLTNFQVIELGHQFVGQYSVYTDHPLQPQLLNCIEKVTFLLSSTNNDDFMTLSMFGTERCLALLRSGDKKWTILEDVNNVEDIISFNGKFYAIEQKGRTIVIEQYLNASFLKLVCSLTSRKFLVQSGDNLLAVEMFYPIISDVGFRIFKLDEEERKWDKMESLGHQILFLGWTQAIAASASEFYWGKGNLIFYSGDCIRPRCNSLNRLMFVFDSDTDTSSPLENCPAYCNLFWSPPEWVTCPGSVTSSVQVTRSNSNNYSETSSQPEMAISTREVGGKSPERETSIGQKVASPFLSSSAASNFVVSN